MTVGDMFAVYADASSPTTRCPASVDKRSAPTPPDGWTMITVKLRAPSTTTCGRCAGRAQGGRSAHDPGRIKALPICSARCVSRRSLCGLDS